MGTVFYSWQADRNKRDCRNLIQRALEDAIQRLKVDMDVEESLRDSLGLDSDTKNVPGSPPIFETILSKIKKAHIFVADLTFVGKRHDGRLMSNPNVLVEYGFALSEPGELRIIAVMNSAYGEPTTGDMPFNLSGRRFPMTYQLGEDATDDERKAAKKGLTTTLESALRAVFESPAYKASEKARRQPTALELAASHREDLDLAAEIDALNHNSEASRVRDAAGTLVNTVYAKILEIESHFDYGLEVGVEGASQSPWLAVRVTPNLGFHINWEPSSNYSKYYSTTEPQLNVRRFTGRLLLPGEPIPPTHRPPEETSTTHYKPTLSRVRELGWVKVKRVASDLSFMSAEDLAELCATEVVKMLRADEQSARSIRR